MGSLSIRAAADRQFPFACIGENWEIFFNGKLVRSEMYIDESGRLKERRTWRDVFFSSGKSRKFLTSITVFSPSFSAFIQLPGQGLLIPSFPILIFRYVWNISLCLC